MTPLRQRMLDALVLRGMALRTQESYIDCVARLARHYGRSPDLLSAQEVRAFMVDLLRQHHFSRSTVNQYGCAFRFLYGQVLGLDGEAFQIPLGIAPQRLPEILSREELVRLFAASRQLKARTFLMLSYGTGLRLSELCRLRVRDIDSAADRMCIRVEQGKGGKDRYVPLQQDTLQVLREWWREAHPRLWLFRGAADSYEPVDASTPQKWYNGARSRAGITKRGGIHTLRHCYATHMLEAGADLYSLSQWLGHRHVSTTSRYLHMVRPDAGGSSRGNPLALLSALPALAPSTTSPPH